MNILATWLLINFLRIIYFGSFHFILFPFRQFLTYPEVNSIFDCLFPQTWTHPDNSSSIRTDSIIYLDLFISLQYGYEAEYINEQKPHSHCNYLGFSINLNEEDGPFLSVFFTFGIICFLDILFLIFNYLVQTFTIYPIPLF